MGDLNYVTNKLNEALSSHSLQDAKIKKLMQMMTVLIAAGNQLSKKSGTMQNSVIMSKCPKVLDQSKLKSLTDEPVKKQYYAIVMKYYEEIVQEGTKDGETQNVKQLRLKQEIPTKELENLVNIFEVIGYFKVAEVLKGAAVDMADKAKGAASDMTDKAKRKITGFFK